MSNSTSSTDSGKHTLNYGNNADGTPVESDAHRAFADFFEFWADPHIGQVESGIERRAAHAAWFAAIKFVAGTEGRPYDEQVRGLQIARTAPQLLAALEDLTNNVKEAMQTGGWVPSPLQASFWESMRDSLDAIAKAQGGAA